MAFLVPGRVHCYHLGVESDVFWGIGQVSTCASGIDAAGKLALTGRSSVVDVDRSVLLF